MPSSTKTADVLTRFLQARVPLIVLRSIEGPRCLDLVRSVSTRLRSMTFYTHSRSRGLFELSGVVPITDDRSLVGALDFATSTFVARPHANFVFTDIDDLGSETPTARHVADVVREAELRQGSVILVVSGPVWSGLSRLGMTAVLDLPDADELYHVVNALVDDHRGVLPVQWQHDEIRQAADTLVGITQTEAVNAMTTLLAKGSLTKEDVAELSSFKDQIMGDLIGIERVKLVDGDRAIGGLATLRTWLDRRGDLIRADLSNTALHPPRGVLLVGVPGCGKSLTAKAIAAQWRLPLYRLDMASILGMYVGVSEGRLKEALEMADRVAPCILWVDEIEKALSGGSDAGTTRRLIGQLLYWLQESTSRVFMVATANDVTSLPPELLRKGRFDEMFFVDLPDEEERVDIIRLYFEKYLNDDPDPSLMRDLVELSDGFAGADLESVVHDIAVEMILQKSAVVPSSAYICSAFANVIPYSKTNPEDIASIRAWAKERAVPAGRMRSDGVASGAGAPRRVMLPGTAVS